MEEMSNKRKKGILFQRKLLEAHTYWWLANLLFPSLKFKRPQLMWDVIPHPYKAGWLRSEYKLVLEITGHHVVKWWGGLAPSHSLSKGGSVSTDRRGRVTVWRHPQITYTNYVRWPLVLLITRSLFLGSFHTGCKGYISSLYNPVNLIKKRN